MIRLKQEFENYKKQVRQSTKENGEKMTLQDTIAYKKQIETRFKINLTNFEQLLRENRLNTENEIEEALKEDSSYFKKENLLYYTAAAAAVAGIVYCAYSGDCSAAVKAGASTISKAVQNYGGKAVEIAIKTKAYATTKDMLRSIKVKGTELGIPKALKYIKAGGGQFKRVVEKSNSKKCIRDYI